jgi:putative ABC transport system permease protein
VMHQWLTDFTSRVSIGAGVFFLAGVGALILAGLTVGAQSLRAAMANPIRALRYE